MIYVKIEPYLCTEKLICSSKLEQPNKYNDDLTIDDNLFEFIYLF
jgi:hypothetical protein